MPRINASYAVRKVKELGVDAAILVSADINRSSGGKFTVYRVDGRGVAFEESGEWKAGELVNALMPALRAAMKPYLARPQ
jgi:hypothetical protein